MTAHVPLHFIGEAPAEATKVGIVNKLVHEVEVECKPADLPSFIEVDISTLETLEDKVLMSDIKLPKGVEITHEADEPVVILTEVREESEEESDNEVDIDSIEVEQKGKAEEETEH
jgi:large subunit ribosomal protein L25